MDDGTQGKFKSDIHRRLELLRRIACLGSGDISTAFDGCSIKEHFLGKYERMREEHGTYGNFKFIFDLDEEYAEKFFEYIGFHGIDLGEKKK